MRLQSAQAMLLRGSTAWDCFGLFHSDTVQAPLLQSDYFCAITLTLSRKIREASRTLGEVNGGPSYEGSADEQQVRRKFLSPLEGRQSCLLLLVVLLHSQLPQPLLLLLYGGTPLSSPLYHFFLSSFLHYLTAGKDKSIVGRW